MRSDSEAEAIAEAALICSREKNVMRQTLRRKIWLVSAIIILIVVLSGGTYYGIIQYTAQQEELRIRNSVESSAIASQSAAIAEELAAMKAKQAALNIETFYEGIYVNDLPLSGLNREMAVKLLRIEELKIRDSFNIKISVADKELTLTPEQVGLTFDTSSVLEKAYETGRIATTAGEAARVNERYAVVQTLKQNPLKLNIKAMVDIAQVRQQIIAGIDSLDLGAKNAKATGFNFSTQTFKIEESKTGLKVDTKAIVDEVINQLVSGNYVYAGSFKGEKIQPEISAAQLRSKLGLISTAKTLAGKSSGIDRDFNISLIIKGLNGLVLQPGEVFSFNGRFGQRTAAKGFRVAGGIRDGLLVQELGGGICQPNTTLCQAVLMANLQIVARSPHSWPSAYIDEPGLDATVSWPGPDFQFKNNTNYPIAIVASFRKPDVVVSIYGNLLDEGVSISLDAVNNGYIKEEPPKVTANNTLAPGSTIVIREARTGQRATTYKIWKKNGTVFRQELAFTSYYRPIQAIIEIGPPLPTPVVTPTPATKPAVT